jgi:hypothetical protein
MSAKTTTVVMVRDGGDCPDSSQLLIKKGRGHGRIVLDHSSWSGDDWDYSGALINPDLGEVCDRWRRACFPGRLPKMDKPQAYRVTIEEISLEEAGVVVEDNRDA